MISTSSTTSLTSLLLTTTLPAPTKAAASVRSQLVPSKPPRIRVRAPSRVDVQSEVRIRLSVPGRAVAPESGIVALEYFPDNCFDRARESLNLVHAAVASWSSRTSSRRTSSTVLRSALQGRHSLFRGTRAGRPGPEIQLVPVDRFVLRPPDHRGGRPLEDRLQRVVEVPVPPPGAIQPGRVPTWPCAVAHAGLDSAAPEHTSWTQAEIACLGSLSSIA